MPEQEFRNLTNAELEDLILRAHGMSTTCERAQFREWDRATPTRVRGQEILVKACGEAARRRILTEIQKRNPNITLRMISPVQDLIDLIRAQNYWVANRGFEHDRNLAKALEELIGYRKAFQNPYLTGEDEEQAWAAAFEAGINVTSDPKETFLAGLHRGFKMRGEIRE